MRTEWTAAEASAWGAFAAFRLSCLGLAPFARQPGLAHRQCRHATQDARFICLKQSASHFVYCFSQKVGYVVVVFVVVVVLNILGPSPVQIKLKFLSAALSGPRCRWPPPHSSNNVMSQSGSTFSGALAVAPRERERERPTAPRP